MKKTIDFNPDLVRSGKNVGSNKDSNVNIKVTKDLKDWIKEKKYSPTRIFENACEWLGYKK